MPLIHVEWFPRAKEKKNEFARAITRICEEVIGSDPKDVEIIFVDVKGENWFVGGQSYDSPPET